MARSRLDHEGSTKHLPCCTCLKNIHPSYTYIYIWTIVEHQFQCELEEFAFNKRKNNLSFAYLCYIIRLYLRQLHLKKQKYHSYSLSHKCTAATTSVIMSKPSKRPSSIKGSSTSRRKSNLPWLLVTNASFIGVNFGLRHRRQGQQSESDSLTHQ